MVRPPALSTQLQSRNLGLVRVKEMTGKDTVLAYHRVRPDITLWSRVEE